MKLRIVIAGIALGAKLATAGEIHSPAEAARSSREDTIEAWGWFFARDEELADLELNENERAIFLRGAADQLRGQPPVCDARAAFADIEKLSTARRAKATARLQQKNHAISDTFFAQLAKNPRFVRLPSGLGYEVIAPGRGEAPKPQQTVTVQYIGRRVDGTEFMQMEHYEQVLVPNRVSRGIFEGVQKIAAGGKIMLYVPPELSAGEEEKLGVPLGAAVVYELALLEVKPTSSEDLANALLPPAPEPPPPPSSGFTTAQLIETWGWLAGQKSRASSFHFSGPEVAAFVRGVETALRNEPLPSGVTVSRNAVTAFVVGERNRVKLALLKQRSEEMNALFTELKKRPEVVELPDGLRYEMVHAGAGPYPSLGQDVVVEYVGRLIDGTVFDRTYNEPLHIRLGAVIDGLTEGIQKMNCGGRIRLYVPPSLGYGDEDVSGVVSRIPAHSVLIYEITLRKILPSGEGKSDGGRK